jgi:multidrug efflux pump subunit AcrA (membrane-fusion protein)
MRPSSYLQGRPKLQVVCILLLISLNGCGRRSATVHPEFKTLTAAVYASGSLAPEQEYKVVSSVTGYLQRSLVKEGDSVRPGQLLFVVSSQVMGAQERGARALVAKTEPAVAPALKQVETQLALARIRLKQDSINYRRYEELLRENVTSKNVYEQYRLKYEGTQSEFAALQQQWQQLKLQGDIQLQQARNNEMLSAAQTASGNLQSFVNGTVYDVYKKEGDLITPQFPVALIGAGELFAKLSVDEDDLNKVYEGQKVMLSMDAFPGKLFHAHITKVYPLLNRVEQSFRADAVLDEPLPVHMSGLNVEANIITAENKRVLAIPKSALMKGDSVMLKEDGKKHPVKIERGIEDEQFVEVRSGITESSEIIVQQ